jgi:hypothetical protein
VSTVDPIAARRAKRVQRAGRPGFLIGALIAGVVQVLAACCLGLGISMGIEGFRLSILDSIFADNDPVGDGFLGVATIPVVAVMGTFGLIVSGLTCSHLLDVYRGGEKRPVLMGPITLWVITAGIFLDSRGWTDPLSVGEQLDPVFHEDHGWSSFGWVMYYAEIWLPALFVVIALLATLYAVKHNARLRKQIAERNRLLAEGRKVTGQITDVTVRTTTNDQGQRSTVGAQVIVKFTDLQGTDRWVTRHVQGREAVPSMGEALVLFDPLRPDAVDAIFVAFVPDPLPGDWIGTVA